MQSVEGGETSRFHPELLKDVKFFQKSMEFALSEEGGIHFPRLEDFKFDKDKYERAINFLRGSITNNMRRKVAKEQADRLYPLDQPKVFQRLI